MSGIRPTLHCPCAGGYLREAARYDRPPAGEIKLDLGGAAYQRAYDRCAVCGHWFGRHEIDLGALYEVSYVNATYGGADGMRARLERILSLPPERSDNAGRVRRILERMKRPSGKQPRVLDVGAGIGVFPAAMKSAGWAVTAIETDARTVAHLRDVVGVDAVAGLLGDQRPEVIGRFDLVTFNKVLEHVEDPVSLLALARTFILPDGRVYVEVPDVAAADESPEREEFFLEHHHVFSTASLGLTLERAGFSVEDIERVRDPSGKYTLVGWGRMAPAA